MVTRWSTRWRKLRRFFSRSEWDVRLLGLPRSEGTSSEPGLLMIQIDGLARGQLERALARGRMPFLRKLLNREGYVLRDFYSGLPAATPAVQGELFFGKKCAVPSFDFFDRKSGCMHRMFSSGPAMEVETRLREDNLPALLQGGSAYCDIYSGGAEEVHFCAVNGVMPARRHSVHPVRRAGFMLWHCMSFVRILFLICVELVVGGIDVLRGVIRGHEIGPELRAIVSRVLVSVGLRELATIGGLMDVARGLPIVHLNYLGYDEQSHRRGPSSRFAHLSLRSIDKAIKQLWSAAQRSAARDYDVWIYSDHGQEHTQPYEHEYGRSIFDAIAAVLHGYVEDVVYKPGIRKHSVPSRSTWLKKGWIDKLMSGEIFETSANPEEDKAISIAAAGPVGHIYFKNALSTAHRELVARKLVAEAGIPLVLFGRESGPVRAFTPQGEIELPRQAAEVLGEDHPFLADVAEDLVTLSRHPDAGELVIAGYRREGLPLTFPIEHGSHAGPGPQETNGFALLPWDAPLPPSEKKYIRALDLRSAALRRLGRESAQPSPRAPRKSPDTIESISLMTYNVHSCIGMDGKLLPTRIARVIDCYQPDVIALQELDVGRRRSGEVDQAHVLAQLVGMDHHFHPAFAVEEEQYGDAVLSHLPMRLVQSGPLPGLAHEPALEPRGAIWVELDLHGEKIQLINTHLGLALSEKLVQVEELLGPRWLRHPQCTGHVILCGDLNCGPRSRPYQLLARRLRDAQCHLTGHRPSATWLSGAPFNRIDHIFVSPSVKITKITVPRTSLTRVASDHLPLILTFSVTPIAKEGWAGEREATAGRGSLAMP